MGVLDRFEKGIERVVNGAFAKAFRSQVEPVELAGALRKESDTRAAVVSRGRTLTANSFTIELSEADMERLSPIADELRADLRQVVGDHAVEQGYSFIGPVLVSLELADDLDTGMYRVRASTKRPDGSPAAQPANRGGYDPASRAHPVVPEVYAQAQSGSRRTVSPGPAGLAPGAAGAAGYGARAAGAGAAGAAGAAGYGADAGVTGAGAGHGAAGPGAAGAGTAAAGSGAAGHHAAPARTLAVDIAGTMHTLGQGTTVFGRSSNSADLVIDDPGVSRRHFEITVSGEHAVANDLGSTNGTLIDGRRITTVTLTDGVVLTAGDTPVVFHDTETGGR